ncbi:MAG: YheC/YheD family protein, partial [bacterium]
GGRTKLSSLGYMSKSIVNIRCCAKACDELGLSYQYYDKNDNFIAVERGEETLFFVNTISPFNSQAVSKICQDKEFTYLLLKDVVKMPKTKGFFCSECEEKYRKYLTHFSCEEMAADVVAHFSLPVIIKMNRGAKGTNVFSCSTKQEVLIALKNVFDKGSHLFDYVALAQEKVNFKREFRVITFRSKIALAYEKGAASTLFYGNLSPLQQDNGRPAVVNDQHLIEQIQKFIDPVFSKLNVVFAGFDIMIDQNNDLWLIEINSSPGMDCLARDSGDGIIVDLYKKMLMV